MESRALNRSRPFLSRVLRPHIDPLLGIAMFKLSNILRPNTQCLARSKFSEIANRIFKPIREVEPDEVNF